MKRILTRSQYLENLKNTQYDNITRINEMIENETKWGDSLLGRLIFSTIRSAKSGYKTKKIEGILKDLQTQLDIIISASLTRDNALIFNETYIKSTLEEIKNVCLSTETDEEKLKQLIGWDGKQYMWDPAEQKTINPDSPGRRIDGVDNIMQNIIDRIKENLPNLESLFGMNRNMILDSLSDFTIELRKLTVELLGGTPGGNTTTIRPFPNIFGKAKEKIMALQDAYIFHRTYYEFLRESEDTNKTISDLKNWFENIKDDTFKTAEEFTGSEKYKTFKNILDNLSEEDKKTLKSDEDIKSFMEEIEKPSPSSSEETDKTEVQSPKTKSILYTTPEGKQVLDEWKEKQKKLGRTNMSPGQGTRSNLEKDVLRRIELNKKASEDKKGPVTNTTTTNPTTGKTGSNSISGSASNVQQNSNYNSYRYYSFDELIRENVGPGGTPSTPTPRTVESIWKDFFEEQDKKEPHRLTQREIEELKRGDKLKVDDLFLDVKKNPDPILALVRIWTRAHNLYFTKMIPSGRTNGAVSQATFLKYIHLGGTSGSDGPGKPDSPGLNWALKSAWDKWTDGVLKILQDQKYRKVLANIKFKVAGAEDSFNKVVGESVKFIVEERDTETDTRTPRDDGRNLFKFMNDLLEPETAGKFETERKKLLNLYFGIDAKEGSLGKLQSTNPSNNEPRKDDIEANSLVWKPLKDLNDTKKFNGFGQSEKGSYFALPLQSTKKDQDSMLFFIVIDKVTIQNKDCNIIKFVFGDEEKLIGRSIKEHDNKKYEKHKYPNWKIEGTKDGGKLHYGIIHMDDKYNYHLVHVNVTDTGKSIENKEYLEKSNISNMGPSKMVEYDSNKNQQKFNILYIKIDGKDNETLKSKHYNDLKTKMENELK